jgi:amino acid transporter
VPGAGESAGPAGSSRARGGAEVSESSLEQLGYKQQLRRGLSVLGNIGVTLSGISPTTGLFLTFPVIIAIAGTGTLLSFAIAAFLVLNLAVTMAELGSMFPLAGGLYAVVARVLGRAAGFVALVDALAQGVFTPAVGAIISAIYINLLDPSINVKVCAGVLMIIITLLALLPIRSNGWLTGGFLILELAVVSALAVAGLSHIHQSLSVFGHLNIGNGHGGIQTVGFGAVITALAATLFAYNAYDGAINYSEETKGSPNRIGRAVVLAAVLAIIFELIPATAAMLGAPHLGAYLNSSTPLTDVIGAAFGHGFVTAAEVGVAIATFNASLAIMLYFARTLWASGRDKAWPSVISSAIERTGVKTGVPWVSTLVLGIIATVLAFQSTLATAVTFTATLIIIMYLLVALAAIVSRVTQRGFDRPWRMPLWPIPPIISFVGVGIVLYKQTGNDLIISAAIFAGALLYYFAFLHSRPDEHWPVHAETAAGQAAEVARASGAGAP